MKTTFLVVLSLLSMSAFAAPKQKAAPKAAPAQAAPAPAPAPAPALGNVTARHVERQYGMAGCGLGSIVIGKKGSQIFASTTNGTFGSQTFGITSGTSNCQDGAADEVAQRMDRFISANKVAVVRDMARGQGETIASLSELMGCTDQMAVGSEMQKNLTRILKNSDGYANVMTDDIMNVVRDSSDLSSDCKSVI